MRPGSGSHSPARQSCTSPSGWAISSGVSWVSGAATRSLRTPRWRSASSEKTRAIRPNASQSDFASHGGGTAWLNACTKGCRSVVERSNFSYQVAAGRTTSENRAFEVIRKSIVVSRSERDVRVLAPAHLARAQLWRGLLRAHAVVLDAEQVLEEVLVPLARGAQEVRAPYGHHARVVARRVGILAREAQTSSPQLAHHVLGRIHARPLGLIDQVERAAIEARIRRQPPEPRAQRVDVGDVAALRAVRGRAARRGPLAGCARSATGPRRGRRTACPTGGAAAASSRAQTRASASPSADAPSPVPRSAPSRRRCGPRSRTASPAPGTSDRSGRSGTNGSSQRPCRSSNDPR